MSEIVKVAILDDYANIAPPIFKHVENIEVHSFPETLDPTDPDDFAKLVEQLKPFSIISTMRERTPFQADLLKALPNLRLLLTTGLRNNGIDGATARSLGITLTGATGTSETSFSIPAPDVPPPADYDSTTQQTWALILALAARLPLNDVSVKTGAWQNGFTTPLGGKTFAAMGLGKLGSRAARIAVQAFGMKVIGWSANLTQEKADEAAEAQGLPRGTFKAVSKQELFEQADLLSVHLVLGERTRGIVGKEDLARLKKTALFVNVSRGPLVDEDALYEVLDKGRIRGAAMDVYWKEPLPKDSRWRTTKWSEDGRSDVVFSPHMGYVNEGTMHAWYVEHAENIKRWLNGEELLHVMN